MLVRSYRIERKALMCMTLLIRHYNLNGRGMGRSRQRHCAATSPTPHPGQVWTVGHSQSSMIGARPCHNDEIGNTLIRTVTLRPFAGLVLVSIVRADLLASTVAFEDDEGSIRKSSARTAPAWGCL